MPCPHCAATATSAQARRTALGYRTFRCRAYRRIGDARTGTPYNHVQYPTDLVLLVVPWRLRDKLRLRDLAELFPERGFVFGHEAPPGPGNALRASAPPPVARGPRVRDNRLPDGGRPGCGAHQRRCGLRCGGGVVAPRRGAGGRPHGDTGRWVRAWATTEPGHRNRRSRRHRARRPSPYSTCAARRTPQPATTPRRRSSSRERSCWAGRAPRTTGGCRSTSRSERQA